MGKEKTEALELIKKLPEDVTTDAIMEELYFKRQVDKGLQDVAEGRVLTHQELKERIAAKSQPLTRPGASNGMVTLIRTRTGGAPRLAAASSRR